MLQTGSALIGEIVSSGKKCLGSLGRGRFAGSRSATVATEPSARCCPIRPRVAPLSRQQDMGTYIGAPRPRKGAGCVGRGGRAGCGMGLNLVPSGGEAAPGHYMACGLARSPRGPYGPVPQGGSFLDPPPSARPDPSRSGG